MYTSVRKPAVPQQKLNAKSAAPSVSRVRRSTGVRPLSQFQHESGSQPSPQGLRGTAEQHGDAASYGAEYSSDFANIPALADNSIPPQQAASDGPLDVVLNSWLPGRERALGLTVDRTIHISPDAWHLPQSEFNHLLAHESVHVAQQNLPGRPGTRQMLEREADSLAPLAMAGRAVSPRVPASPRVALRSERTIGTDKKSQRRWVRRVDKLVRTRFRLTRLRRRMTDRRRVKFQDRATYIRGFGRGSRDLLIDAFAEHWGNLVGKIKDFYNYYSISSLSPHVRAKKFVNAHIATGFFLWDYQALNWSDFGLKGIADYPFVYAKLERVPGNPGMVKASVMVSVTRAQALIAARRQPEVEFELTDGPYGFTWPVNPSRTTNVTFSIIVPMARVTRRVSGNEILAETLSGVTSGGARGRRWIRIQSTPGRPARPARGRHPVRPAIPPRPANVSTLVHEACHFYTHDAFNRYVASVRKLTYRSLTANGMPVLLSQSPVLAEGFTEYFTRMLMREQAAVLGPVGSGAYPTQYQAAKLVITSMNPPSAAESAYFHGRGINKVRAGIQFVKKNPHFIRLLHGPSGVEDALRGVGSSPERRAPPRRDRSRLRTPQDVRER